MEKLSQSIATKFESLEALQEASKSWHQKPFGKWGINTHVAVHPDKWMALGYETEPFESNYQRAHLQGWWVDDNHPDSSEENIKKFRFYTLGQYKEALPNGPQTIDDLSFVQRNEREWIWYRGIEGELEESIKIFGVSYEFDANRRFFVYQYGDIWLFEPEGVKDCSSCYAKVAGEVHDSKEKALQRVVEEFALLRKADVV